MAVPPEAVGAVSTMLQQLMSSDNVERTQAEAALNTEWLEARPQMLLPALASVLVESGDESARALAAVLLRRIAPKPTTTTTSDGGSVWMAVGEDAREAVQAMLLRALLGEGSDHVRRKAGDCVAELARHMISKGGVWGGLTQTLFSLLQSPTAAHRASAFAIVAALPAAVSGQSDAALVNALSTGLADSDAAVRLAAQKAAVQWLIETGAATAGPLFGLIFGILPPLIPDSEDDFSSAMESLIELAEDQPKLFRGSLNKVVAFLAQVMKEDSLEESSRQVSLELLLTLAEVAPGTCRKEPSFVPTVIPIMLQWMTTVQDDEAWYSPTAIVDDDEEDLCAVAEQGLDRIARHLGGKVVLPITFQFIPQMVANNNWLQRHAALMAISAIGEGCMKIMSTELEKIVDMILPHLKDPHARVRYAACNAIGQMSTDFAPRMQKLLHAKVLPALIEVMDDQQPRVQAHAAAALVNFSEQCAKRDLNIYLDSLFERLLRLIDSPAIYVKEQALTTIATIADSAEDLFGKYYAHIMPGLLHLLKISEGSEYRALRGKAMECATLIALAVGKEIFRPHANEMVAILGHIQVSITEPDDPQASYLLGAWARICKVMGSEFTPYLDTVMPPLIKAAQIKPDFMVLEYDEEPSDEFAEEDGWQFLPVEGQKIGIKTSALEEKCTALEMLICYSRELGADFIKYTDQVLQIVIPLLKFWFHDGVRHAAVQNIPFLLESYKKADLPQDQLLRIWHEIGNALLDASSSEQEVYIVTAFFSVFGDCLNVIGNHCLTSQLMEAFSKAAIEQLREVFSRVQERNESRKDPDHDPEEEETLQEEEENDDMLMQELSRAFHEVFRTHGVGFLPYAEPIIPVLNDMLQSKRAEFRQWGLCIYDDLIEFTGPESFRYAPFFAEKMVNALQDSSWDVRQTASYGIGVMAQFGGDSFFPVLTAAIPLLTSVISTNGSRDDDKITATENAISALGKICRFKAPVVADFNAVLNLWFQSLPIVVDDEEAPHVYNYLFELIENRNPIILGEKNSNLPKLVEIFSGALTSDILKPEITDKMVLYLKGLMASCEPPVREALWMTIRPEQKAIFVEKGWV